MKPETKDPMEAIVGKTIKSASFSKTGPEVDLTFTDGTQFSMLVISRPTSSLMYFWGEGDDECLRKQITGTAVGP